MDAGYRSELLRQTGMVLEESDAENHLRRFPWLTGALGEPWSGVWFVAENPSLTMVERATSPGGRPATEEAQWYASRGDKLFRDMLYKHGFKETPPDALGGWRCYITNLIKEPDYSQRWRGSSQARRDAAADLWAPVFAWELSAGKPKLLVALGQTVRKVLTHFERRGVALPRTETIAHYSYIAHRPEGKLGPMHPERLARYDAEFGRIRALADQLRRPGGEAASPSSPAVER